MYHFVGFSVGVLFLIGRASGDGPSLVSVSSRGEQASNLSLDSSISRDGRFVAFSSFASDLTPNDRNQTYDVFVHDRLTLTTSLESKNSSGVQGDLMSKDASISGNGRFLVFGSSASNMGSAAPLAYSIYLRDLVLRQTTMVSVSSAGVPANRPCSNASVSDDGRYVVFQSQADNLVAASLPPGDHVFVRDVVLATTELLDQAPSGLPGNSTATYPRIASGGRYIVFQSHSSNLVTPDLNGFGDVFIHDLVNQRTSLVSLSTSGSQGNSSSGIPYVSSDGRFVAFASSANNLVNGDTNGTVDVFVVDTAVPSIVRASITASGVQGDLVSSCRGVSDDGRYVVFDTASTTFFPALQNGFGQIYRKDLLSGVLEIVSVDGQGVLGNRGSTNSSLSGSGAVVSFHSPASNLVQNDMNGFIDVFAIDAGCPGCIEPYGASCGSTIHPLLLSAAGCANAGEAIGLWVKNGLPNVPAVIVFGQRRAQVPLGAGCVFLLGNPFGSPAPTLLLGATGDGLIVLSIPPAASPAVVTAQAFSWDAPSPLGISVSNGLEITLR